MRDSEFKKNIDAATLRYFPWIGNCWVRYLISTFMFLPYVYLIYPFQRLARENFKAIVLFALFVSSVLADHSYLLEDVQRSISAPHIGYRGLLLEYQGRRGLGTAHILVSDGVPMRFKLLSVRGKGSRDIIEEHVGQNVLIRYIEAKGLITNWHLPVQIFLSTGEVLYDYQDHMEWFASPQQSFDSYIIIFFKLVVLIAVVFFPLNFMHRLFGQEVQYELNKQSCVKSDNGAKS